MKLPPKAPKFWAHDGFAARLLGPFGLGYDLLGRLHRSLMRPVRLDRPVVCVGNLTMGGAGKTPVVIAFLEYLSAKGLSIHAVSRGYGGRYRGPLKVDPERHDAADVGDEPLLMARKYPVWVARDRVSGARAARDAGADVIVLDDGFQNPSLHKDLSVVVVDGAYGFGNGRVFPAGPLRETVDRGLARADAIVVLGDSADGGPQDFGTRLPVLTADLVPAQAVRDLAEEKVFAFAGIARPEKFFTTLREVGAHVIAERSFADHHPYSDKDIEQLLREASSLGAVAVTTEKDAVRIPREKRQLFRTIPVEIRWRQPDSLGSVFEGIP